jgi:hypothetical protein
MIFKYFHLGLRQVVMVLMNWAIDVPQELLQSDAKTGTLNYFIITFLFSLRS